MTTLGFDIFWRDHGASKGMKGLGTDTDKTTGKFDRFKGVAIAAGAVAGAAIFKFGKDSVKAYSEAESSQARLQDAFRKFPKLADTNIGSLRNLNTQLAQKTRFDDDATASGQAVLAQFKLTGTQITQLTPLLQDYAAKTGKDLPTAAKDLGRAMLGQGRSLKAVGINFKDTGSAGGNFEQIMGGLRTQVGGFAQREGKTAAVQAVILRNQFGELQEEVGAKLLPALLAVGRALLNVVGFVQRNGKVIGPLVGGVAALAAVIWTVNAASRAAAAAQAAWVTVMGASTAATSAQTGAVVRQRAAMAGSVGVVGGVTLGIAALTRVLGEYIGRGAVADVATRDLADSMATLGKTGQFTGASKGLFEPSFFTRLATGIDYFGTKVKTSDDALRAWRDMAQGSLGGGMREWHANITGLSSAFDKAAASQDKALAVLVQTGRIDEAKAAFDRLTRGVKGVPVSELAAKFPEFAAAMTAAKRAAEPLTGALNRQAGAAGKTAEELRKYAGQVLGLRGSQNSFEAAVDDATAALKANGKTLDVHTGKGRANRSALDSVASSTLEWRDATKEAGGSVAKQNVIMETGRKRLVAMGIRFGLTEKKADNYAAAVLGIPKRHDTQINAQTAAAERKIRDFKRYTNRQLNAINDERVYIALKPPPGVSIRQLMGDGYGVGGGPRGDGYGVIPRQSGPPRGDGFGVKMSSVAQTASRREMSDAIAPIMTRYGQMAKTIAGRVSAALQKKLMLGGGSAAGGWRRQWALVHAAFPGARLHSAYRPGARTATGNRSYHAMGRAVDVTPSMRIFNWIRANYGKRTKELIYSPAGGRQLHNGANHYYSGVTRAMHFNHIHWAYDKGGYLPPGLSMAYNGTGKPERVTPHDQPMRLHADDIRALAEGMGRVVLAGIGANNSSLARSADRLVRGG